LDKKTNVMVLGVFLIEKAVSRIQLDMR